MSHDGFDAVQATHNLLSEALAPTPVFTDAPEVPPLPEEPGLYIAHMDPDVNHSTARVFTHDAAGDWYIGDRDGDRKIAASTVVRLIGAARLVRLITETEADL